MRKGAVRKIPDGKMDNPFLKTFGRRARECERKAAKLETAVKHLKGSKTLGSAIEDLGWVLSNSKEFLFRH